MSNTNNDTSDVKKAAEQADKQQIEKNLWLSKVLFQFVSDPWKFSLTQ